MTRWQASWIRPLADVRAFALPLRNATLRLRAVAGQGGGRLRIELSNAFGDQPLEVGRVVVIVGGVPVEACFNGAASTVVPAGASCWTDPVAATVRNGDDIVVDLYVPSTLPLATGNFARTPVEIARDGDHAGETPFPASASPTISAPDGSDMPIPVPYLRSIEVEVEVEVEVEASRVVACLGDSITAGGWPEVTASLLAPHSPAVMLNLGIAGNRLRVDPSPDTASFGRSGESRFSDDVLLTSGVTDLVIALGTNDLGLPGSAAPLNELPTADELAAAYARLIERAQAQGIRVIIATITPFRGADGISVDRERLRDAVNAWIRTTAPEVADFDAAVRSETDPDRLAEWYDSGDHLHPNDAGEAALARIAASALSKQW